MKKFKFFGVNKKFFFGKIFNNIFKKQNTSIKTDQVATVEVNENVLTELKWNSNKDLISKEKNEMKIINEKYEIYNKYEPNEMLKVDKDFGDVVRYEEFLDEGKEKFENVLTKYMEENRELENNKDYKTLSKIVEEKSKLFYSNYKEEYKYNLEAHEERWYKEAIYSKKTNDLDVFYKREDPMRKRPVETTNRKEKAKEMEEKAFEPDHPTYPTQVKTPFESYVDSFQWLFNVSSKETQSFINSELLYSQNCLFKYSTLESNILEDIGDNNMTSPPCALQLGNTSTVYKKSSEDVSLYRVNSNSIEPESRGVLDFNDLKSRNIEPEEIFGLKDFIQLNKRFTDLSFLDFARRLLDNIELERELLVNFQLCPKEQFLVLFFDMNGDMKSFDILIKDIKNDVLLPVVIYNSDGNVAFDSFDGLFYSQLDLTSRSSKVFRHQIGTAHRTDSLIYHEKNQNFKVKTYNCNSKQMVYIEVDTNNIQGVSVNEIWFKPAGDLDKVDFTCIKKMEKNINYTAKFSNGAFYMLINKSDTYDKSLKKIRVNNQMVFGLIEHSKVNDRDNSIKEKKHEDYKINSKALTNLSQVTDIANNEDKQKVIDIFQEALANSRSIIPLFQDLIKVDEYINIIDFEIFKNYLVVLEEVDQKRRFKIFNLLTNNYYLHEPALEHMSIKLADNCAFDTSYFRYILSSPVDPHRTVDYAMATRKAYNVHTNNYQKYDPNKYKTELIYVDDRDKETKIPVILAYKEDLYNTDSPFILYTKGTLTTKENLEFNDMLVGLMDKGFVWAIPQVRGTKSFDFNWYAQGIAENKFKHFTDFIDVAFHLKDNLITDKIIMFGDGYSGGLTAAVSFIQNPTFFSSIVLLNTSADVFDLCMTNGSDINIVEEFGDIKIKQFYEMMKLYSPYHTLSPTSHSPILIACDEKDPNVHHSFKFTAKLRRKNKQAKRNNKVFFEILSARPSPEEKYAFISSFIIGETYLK